MGIVKRDAKRRLKKKLVIGKCYKLRIKSVEGSPLIETKWRCVQLIHKIKDEIVNIVIMQPMTLGELFHIQGLGHQSFCLSKADCKKYHIRYNPYLEVFSEHLNWIETKDEAIDMKK